MILSREGSVIILGAGASVPFGLPTGLGLVGAIQNRLKTEIFNLSEAKRLGKSLNDFPYTASLLDIDTTTYKFIGNEGVELSKIESILIGSTSDTIDDLIRLYPEYSTQLKKAIVFELLEKTHFKDKNGNYHLESVFEREFPILNGEEQEFDKWYGFKSKRNWVHQLINIVRNEYLDPSLSIGDKVKIISFNYDGILECILDQKWRGKDFGLPEWQDVFEISHPHGVIPALKNVGFRNVKSYLDENFQKIVVVREASIPPFEISEQRDKAWKWIGRADEIKAIGFAFARSNCNLIGLESKWAEQKKSITFLNYDDSYGLRERVSRFQGHRDLSSRDEFGTVVIRNNIIERNPRYGERLDIHEAIMAGFLGEMPS